MNMVFIKNWLVKQASIREAEEAHRVNGVSFGFMHDEWESLKSKMLSEDELWEFDSGPESWEQLMGWRGYAVVRNGEVVDMVITELN